MIKSKLYDNTLYISLYGELDENNAAKIRLEMENAIKNNKFQQIIIDLSELSFMDSTGIGVLIGRYKLLKAQGVPVFISSPNNQVDKIFKMTGLYDIMPKIN